MIVVDTSVFVDHLRGSVPARRAWEQATTDRNSLVASVVSKAELLMGMRSQERAVTRALMESIAWIPISGEIAELAGRQGRRFRRSHGGIDIADYLIGATAEHLGADLWTRNVRHFPMFPDLRAPYGDA